MSVSVCVFSKLQVCTIELNAGDHPLVGRAPFWVVRFKVAGGRSGGRKWREEQVICSMN